VTGASSTSFIRTATNVIGKLPSNPMEKLVAIDLFRHLDCADPRHD